MNNSVEISKLTPTSSSKFARRPRAIQTILVGSAVMVGSALFGFGHHSLAQDGTTPDSAPPINAPINTPINALAQTTSSPQGNSAPGTNRSTLPTTIEEQVKVTTGKDLGGRLVFTLEFKGSRHLMAADLETGHVGRLVSGDGENYQGRLSPDGKKLAFVSTRTGTPQLYIADWRGTEISQLTTSALPKGYPTWSADSQNLYFTQEQGKGEDQPTKIYSLNLQSRAESPVVSLPQRNTAPSAHPTLPRVGFTTNRIWPGWDICVWDTDSKKESCILSGDSSYIKPKFSPAGTHLAVVRSRGRVSQVGIFPYQDSKKPTVFVPEDGKQTDPEWADNGEYLLYSVSDEAAKRFEIKLYSVRNGAVRTLIQSGYSLKEASWSSLSGGRLAEARLLSELKAIKSIEFEPTPSNYVPQYYRNPPTPKPEEGQ